MGAPLLDRRERCHDQRAELQREVKNIEVEDVGDVGQTEVSCSKEPGQPTGYLVRNEGGSWAKRMDGTNELLPAYTESGAQQPLSLFLACVPPTTTHQRKRIVRVAGHARLADSPELQATRQLLEVLLLPHRPPAPFAGPVRLELTFTWPWLSTHSKRLRAAGRVPKATKPDADNLAKVITDRLTALRFIEDDARVVALFVEKWFGAQPGIGVCLIPVCRPEISVRRAPPTPLHRARSAPTPQ